MIYLLRVTVLQDAQSSVVTEGADSAIHTKFYYSIVGENNYDIKMSANGMMVGKIGGEGAVVLQIKVTAYGFADITFFMTVNAYSV